jgi:uncharacterized protein
MHLNNFLQIFIPKDNKFFLLFEKATGNLVNISAVLYEMVNTSSQEKRKELIRQIEHLEHIGDNITHDIFNELSSNFITPFDREDINELTAAIDDVVDFIHGSSKRIDLYKIETITPAISKLAELILSSSQELHVAVSELKNMKDLSKIKEACVKINSIENHADDIFDNAIARLFEDEKNAVEVIKMKEVLSALETATDKCEDASDVLKSIIVKNA